MRGWCTLPRNRNSHYFTLLIYISVHLFVYLLTQLFAFQFLLFSEGAMGHSPGVGYPSSACVWSLTNLFDLQGVSSSDQLDSLLPGYSHIYNGIISTVLKYWQFYVQQYLQKIKDVIERFICTHYLHWGLQRSGFIWDLPTSEKTCFLGQNVF